MPDEETNQLIGPFILPDEETDTKKDKQENIEDLPLRRPTSFSKAHATTKIGATHALSRIEEWAKGYDDQMQAAAAAAQKEAEDKGFWGKLATWGTTLGCAAVSVATTAGTTLGGCVALGTAVGAGTRYAIDKGNDWESSIPRAVEDLNVKYYRDKIPEIAEEINDAADNLQEWNDNQWKADIMAQLGDSFSAYKMGSAGINLAKIGVFGEGVKGKAGEWLTTTTGMDDPLLERNIIDPVDETKAILEDIIKVDGE